ncbi:MAG: EpsI family protein [Betaproteobacteria bacterium]|nr:EpsI family protein [Betaproteobacteria bacterium]
MLRFSFKHIMVGLVMVGAVGLSYALTPKAKIADQRSKLDLETMIPQQFGDWKVDETIVPLQVSPDLQAALNKVYNQTLSRTYVNSKDERIMLSIAYGTDQSDNVQVHLPEGCYRGQGFAISKKTESVMQTLFGNIPVAKLVATREAREEPITYWVLVGGQIARDNWEMKKAKLKFALKGEVPDGILIRVSSITSDVSRGYELQREFSEAMLAALPASYRSRLIGSGSAG